MDDLFGRLAADLGVDRAATEMAVGILLRFQKERPPEKVCENSRDEAVGGIARAVPCHSFDV